MTKHKFIATDTILVGKQLKQAGDEFEVSGEKAVEKAKARGHLPAESKEAQALVEKISKRKKSAPEKKTLAPAKNSFNAEEKSEKEKDKKVLSQMSLSELQLFAKDNKLPIEDDKGKAFTRKELIAAIEAQAETQDEESADDLA